MLGGVLLPMARVVVIPALDHPQVLEQLAQELQVVPRERHLVRERQLAPTPHEVAQCIILLVVVPLGVLQAGLANEANVGAIHPSLGRTLHVLVATQHELDAVGLVRQQERRDGGDAGLRILATLALRIGQIQAVRDDAVVAQPAAEHGRSGVVAFRVRRRGAEGAGELAVLVLALGPGHVQRAMAIQQVLDLLKLLQVQRLKLFFLGIRLGCAWARAVWVVCATR
mmetsp:Transcript_54150/g.175984  ORF Transcript_54150/g.175984 Transcript_54150/m.175984 type:complete len:226 (+) Transcript_54150:3193-3870(+)